MIHLEDTVHRNIKRVLKKGGVYPEEAKEKNPFRSTKRDWRQLGRWEE